MKEQYIKPVTETDVFKTINVVTTSGIDDTQKGDTDLPFGD